MDGLSLNPQTSMSQAATTRLTQLESQFKNPQNKEQKSLKQAAQEFEAIFVQQFLEAMDKTVDRSNSILSGGSAEEYFRSMLNEHVAQSMTTGPGGSGFGLAEAIYRDMAGNLRPTPLAPKSQIGIGSVSSTETGE